MLDTCNAECANTNMAPVNTYHTYMYVIYPIPSIATDPLFTDISGLRHSLSHSNALVGFQKFKP